MQAKTAILLVAHGSRAPQAKDEFLQVVAALRAQVDYPIVEAAWLEITPPDIATGLSNCRAAGATKIILVPYFLNSGNHILRDIPAIIAKWQAENPEITVIVGQHLGLSQHLINLLQERITTALASELTKNLPE